MVVGGMSPAALIEAMFSVPVGQRDAVGGSTAQATPARPATMPRPN
jgi:hypothetical protein